MQTKQRTPRSRLAKTGWALIASGILTAFTVFVLLDTFVIARAEQTMQQADLSSIVSAQQAVAATTDADESDSAGTNSSSGTSGSTSTSGSASSSSGTSSAGSSAPSIKGSSSSSSKKPGHRNGSSGQSRGSSKGGPSGSSKSSSTTTDVSQVVAGAAAASSVGTSIGSYSDDNMKIEVSSVRAYDTDIYVADITVSSAEYLKTAFAQNSFGRNLKDTTSNMAEEAGAILAINGDYYGFRDEGYVLRNGVLYRDTAAANTNALVVYGDGTMAAANQDSTSAQSLKDAGAWQVFSFGPVLVENGAIAVSADSEVSQSMGSNPRTAIGMVDPLHYVVVVSDGRTGDNAGLSLYELAQVLLDNGATFAYNLDGGGSTTMYFKGEVINNPTSGNIGGERSVSDIVYFG